MKSEPDKKHFIPIIDCPDCGARDTPLSTKGPFVPGKKSPLYGKKDEEGNPIEIWISFCPCCDRVPYDESEIKGYASKAEIEEMGYREAKGLSLLKIRAGERLSPYVGRAVRGIKGLFRRD